MQVNTRIQHHHLTLSMRKKNMKWKKSEDIAKKEEALSS